MTTNVANTATVRRFIFVILSVLKVFCFALRSSERVVLRVVLCSAGAECFLAPQEQNVSLLRRSRMFLCSAGATFLCSAGATFLCFAGAECFFAPQEQRFFASQEQNVSWLRRSN